MLILWSISTITFIVITFSQLHAVVPQQNDEAKFLLKDFSDSSYLRRSIKNKENKKYDRILEPNDKCSITDSLFDTEILPKDVADWMAQKDDPSISFLKALSDLYIDVMLTSATGKQIKDDPYPEVCQRLPLISDNCYAVSNPNGSFFETLVARYIPFGDKIIEVKKNIDDFMQTVSDTAEDFQSFFFDQEEEPGTCIVVNEDMVGIAENPGFPQPFVYELCNCLSLKTNGVYACTVQPYFRGFAFSTGKENALQYDLSDHLNRAFFFYDGYLEYEFQPFGDFWASMDLEIKVPKLTKVNKLQDLICAPSKGKKKELKKPPKVNIKTALFVKSNLDDTTTSDGELLVLVSIEEFDFIANKFVEINLGSAVGALRIRSSNPDCKPSGIYASIQIEPQLKLGDGLNMFLKQLNLDMSARAYLGVTWLDDGSADEDDYIQSIFLRIEVESYEFMGINVGKATAEIQYFDDREFSRRRNFDIDKCCSNSEGEGEITSCGVSNSALETFINRNDITPQPTIGFFIDIQDLNWHNIVDFKSIKAEFIYQLATDEFATRLYFSTKCTVLFISKLSITVLFEMTEGSDNWIASFSASMEVDIGIGIVGFSVDASAAVGDYTYDDEKLDLADRRHLSSRSSLLDADWSLNLSIDMELSEWVEQLGEYIYDGLKFAYDELKFGWDQMYDFINDAFNSIVDLASDIGGAFEDVFNAIKDTYENIGESLDGVLDNVVNFFDGHGFTSIFSEELAGILGSGADEIINISEDAMDLASDIFNDGIDDVLNKIGGDYLGKIGEYIGLRRRLFGPVGGWFEDLIIRDAKEVKAGDLHQGLNCPLMRWTWKECKPTCSRKYSKTYPEKKCIEEKMNLIKKMKEKAEEAEKSRQCYNDSRNKNQGLQWVGDETKDTVIAAINPIIKNTDKLNIGTTSELHQHPENACQNLPFELEMNPLASDSAGVTPNRKTVTDLSKHCIKFDNQQEFSSTMFDFLASDVAASATNAALGDNQGTDEEVKNCMKEAVGTTMSSCTLPFLKEGSGFKEDVTIDCSLDDDDLLNKLSFEDIFGKVTLLQDGKCDERANHPERRRLRGSSLHQRYRKSTIGHPRRPHPIGIPPRRPVRPVPPPPPPPTPSPTPMPIELEQKFTIISVENHVNDNLCIERIVKIDRTVMDCCNQWTTPITHTLVIKKRPPQFTTTLGSMDVELSCDANISPNAMAEGYAYPEYFSGCRSSGSFPHLTFSDGDIIFDLTTCTSTIERTFVLSDGCEGAANQREFRQKITLSNDYLPEWDDDFPQDVTVGVFDDYGTDAMGYPTVFQRCGVASPIEVTYTDNILSNDDADYCFFERRLVRTFTAVDSCGHKSVRDQLITIKMDPKNVNQQLLARLYYSSNKAVRDDSECQFDADEYGIVVDEPEIDSLLLLCDDDNNGGVDEELLNYKKRLFDLSSVDDTSHLGATGARHKQCRCPDGDATCDLRENIINPNVIFAMPVVFSAQDQHCQKTTIDESRLQYEQTQHVGLIQNIEIDCIDEENTARNHHISIDEGKCPDYADLPSCTAAEEGCFWKHDHCWKINVVPSKVLCKLPSKRLVGVHPIYNIFDLDINDFKDISIIEISAPKTSIVLINVLVLESDEISRGGDNDSETILDEATLGVTLIGDDDEVIQISNVIFNVHHDYTVVLNESGQSDYDFLGGISHNGSAAVDERLHALNNEQESARNDILENKANYLHDLYLQMFDFSIPPFMARLRRNCLG